ncbi:nuclear pore protein 84/107 [Wallemia mellicola]|uniref:Nuclear pore complex protein n=1 Tax=Wallemia mellicola TaxID=1708541 RepID=A0A4T0QSL9_9BASI|nr:nuclear pore protein 84/107 [Wallemia mellicola]
MTVYQDFARILSEISNNQSNSVLELPDLFAQLCEKILKTNIDQSEREAWSLERNTWNLIHALYDDRLNGLDDGLSAKEILAANKYTPPLTLTQPLISQSKELMELNAIRQWLHNIPTPLYPVEIRKGYQTYTKNKLKLAVRQGNTTTGLVTSLDPDAPVRQHKQLDVEDSQYDKPLTRTLFEYVRLGRMDLALDACRSSDQPWRAASLRGGQLWDDPSLASEEIALNNGISGNKQRKLWKQIASQLSENPDFDPYERALYGCLSGSLSSVLPVCNSWEDHLWARVNALMERKIDDSLKKTGGYWYDNVDTVKAQEGEQVAEDLEGIFEEILKLGGDVGNSAHNPFRITQTNVMLERTSHLLTNFASQIQQTASMLSPDAFAHLLRFFAHLVLFLRAIDGENPSEDVPNGPAEVILEAYVRTLEQRNETKELVGMYAGCLGEGAGGESFAHYLYSLDIATPIDVRKAALLQTLEHGLDLERVACRTVELTLIDTFARLPEIPIDAPDITAFANTSGLSYKDLSLVRSIEWLIFAKETYRYALIQSNGLMRYFLTSGNVSAAFKLLESLPADLMAYQPNSKTEEDDMISIDDQIVEYSGYQQLFELLDSHTKLVELWTLQPDTNKVAKLDYKAWSDQVEALTHIVKEKTMDIFTTEWMRLGADAHEKRVAELERIREIYIPELVHRLHSSLYSAKSIHIRYIDEALNLANTVADERYRIYLEFVRRSTSLSKKGVAGSNTLASYLSLVKSAALSKLHYEELAGIPTDVFKHV